MTFCRCPGGGGGWRKTVQRSLFTPHTVSINISRKQTVNCCSWRVEMRWKRRWEVDMLDKNVIKMHQALHGLFRGNMILFLCGIGRRSYTKRYWWRWGKANENSVITAAAFARSLSLSLFSCRTFPAASLHFGLLSVYSWCKFDKSGQTYDSGSHPTFWYEFRELRPSPNLLMHVPLPLAGSWEK